MQKKKHIFFMTEFVGAILILSAIAEKPLFIVCVCVCSQNKIILLWTVCWVEKTIVNKQQFIWMDENKWANNW